MFASRHIGTIKHKNKIKYMLETCGVKSINELINKIKIKEHHNNHLIQGESEEKALSNLKNMMKKNKLHKSYLGLGYYNTETPSPIKRHILENPKWYTAYTPYQAEISQGRLESQYNYQELVKSLTGLPYSNASLLDEASAAGEALNLSYAYYKKKKKKLIVSEDIHPQTLDVLDTRASTLGIKMELMENVKFDDLDPKELCNIIFQYPDTKGDVDVPFDLIDFAKQNDILTTGITDLLALTKLVTPGELGIDITLGNAQRLGVPLWYGGPHPAYFAVSKNLLRYMPGRIIGESRDKMGKKAYRLALQTREQHIKQGNATSNICTSQSLLTNVVSFYGIYHGKKGLKEISKKVNNKAKYFLEKIYPLKIENKTFYDTITIKVKNQQKMIGILRKNDILARELGTDKIALTFDETITNEDIDKLAKIIKNVEFGIPITIRLAKENVEELYKNYKKHQLPDKFRRKTDYLTDDTFKKYNTETELLRYIHNLSLKDYSLCDGMIPLGSCTMKLNSAYQLEPLMWEEVCKVHPFAPLEYAEGYEELIKKTGDYLKKLTGFTNISFQPNSGAMGEYAGLLTIKKYHEEHGERRDICLIPKSAHGTNFASAAVANLKVVTFDDELFKDLERFRSFVGEYKEDLACLMITYPGTNGVFQDNIEKITNTIHDCGGLVYMDGANMNALVCLSLPSNLGFDICHLNLHKTFCIPHGGGGPGLGPILCNDKLAPYLPSNVLQDKEKEYINNKLKNELSTYVDRYAVSGSNWSSASLLTIPYLYISAMGTRGLKRATEMALLNSNYLKSLLREYYKIEDVNENGMVGHEFIIDVSEFKRLGITENDIAKRLIDYSFHPPTMSWPRSGVLMIEPTESESKEELDRFVEAMKGIRREIKEIEEEGLESNVIKNAPHCFPMTNDWKYSYPIEKAFYPVDSLLDKKFNIPVARVDDVYGDRFLLKK